MDRKSLKVAVGTDSGGASPASQIIDEFALGIISIEDRRRELGREIHADLYQWSGDVARKIEGLEGLEDALEEWVRHDRWSVRALVSGASHLLEHRSFTVWAMSRTSYASQTGEDLSGQPQVSLDQDPDSRYSSDDDFDHYLDWIADFMSEDPNDNSRPCTECGRFVDIDNDEYCPWCDTVGDPHDPDWDEMAFREMWNEYRIESYRKYMKWKSREREE